MMGVYQGYCKNPSCECHQTVEKNDAPDWGEKLEALINDIRRDGSTDSVHIHQLVAREKALSYEEGKDVGVSEVIYHKDSYQKGYEEGKAYWEPSEHHKDIWRKEGFKAGIARAMEATREAPAQGHASNRAGEGAKQHLIIREDLLTTLEKL